MSQVSIDMLFASLPHYTSLPASPPPPLDATPGTSSSSATADEAAAPIASSTSSNSTSSSTGRSSASNHGSLGTSGAYEWSSDPELERAFLDETLLAGLKAHAANGGGGDSAEATLRSING